MLGFRPSRQALPRSPSRWSRWRFLTSRRIRDCRWVERMSWNRVLIYVILGILLVAYAVAAVAVWFLPDEWIMVGDTRTARSLLLAVCVLFLVVLSVESYCLFYDPPPHRLYHRLIYILLGFGGTVTAFPFAVFGLKHIRALGIDVSFQEAGI